jgi:hypothetical protein
MSKPAARAARKQGLEAAFREWRTALAQMFAGPIRGIGFAHRQSNCAFFGGWTNHFEVLKCRHFSLPRLDDCVYIAPSSIS